MDATYHEHPWGSHPWLPLFRQGRYASLPRGFIHKLTGVLLAPGTARAAVRAVILQDYVANEPLVSTPDLKTERAV
jgi:hypothetical protein